MILASAVVLVVGATLFLTLFVREKDIPAPDPVSPVKHMDERKAAIYENLRDLQFEYRVGKLSDSDYQQTKVGLQKELAVVLAEIEKLSAKAAGTAASKAPAPAKAAAKPATSCPHCGAKFSRPLKFCGECGKAMA